MDGKYERKYESRPSFVDGGIRTDRWNLVEATLKVCIAEGGLRVDQSFIRTPRSVFSRVTRGER